jgi:hypothetical protein
MKKLLLLLALASQFANAQITPDYFVLSEYASYPVAKGKIYRYVDAIVGKTTKLAAYAIPDSIVSASAGLHNVVAVGSSGRAYFVHRGDLGFDVLPITNGVSSTGIFSTYAVITSDKTVSIVREDTLQKVGKLNAKNVIQAKASYDLITLDGDGNVFDYAWKPWATTALTDKNIKSVSDIINLQPTKVQLPGPASMVTSGLSGHSAAIVNGDVYVWGYDPRHAGFANGGITIPQKLSTPEKIKSIEAGPESLHMIGLSGKLYGLGDQAQGEVGNGVRDPRVISTNTRDGAWKMILATVVEVGRGRTYDLICKGNSYCFYTFARETNGMWSSWGGRAKGGILANGIFMFGETASSRSNIGDVAAPTRITVPVTGMYVADSMFAAKYYPPSEPADPAPPAPPKPAPTLLLTIHVYTDKTTSTAKSINKKKTLLADIRVYEDGSIQKQ